MVSRCSACYSVESHTIASYRDTAPGFGNVAYHPEESHIAFLSSCTAFSLVAMSMIAQDGLEWRDPGKSLQLHADKMPLPRSVLLQTSAALAQPGLDTLLPSLKKNNHEKRSDYSFVLL